MSNKQEREDWPSEDPLWQALGHLPKAELPPGFPRLVMERALRKKGLPELIDAVRDWVLTARPAFPPKKAILAAATAAFAAVALFLALPDRGGPIQGEQSGLQSGDIPQTEEELDLIKNLDAYLASEENEQWLFGTIATVN